MFLNCLLFKIIKLGIFQGKKHDSVVVHHFIKIFIFKKEKIILCYFFINRIIFYLFYYINCSIRFREIFLRKPFSFLFWKRTWVSTLFISNLKWFSLILFDLIDMHHVLWSNSQWFTSKHHHCFLITLFNIIGLAISLKSDFFELRGKLEYEPLKNGSECHELLLKWNLT